MGNILDTCENVVNDIIERGPCYIAHIYFKDCRFPECIYIYGTRQNEGQKILDYSYGKELSSVLFSNVKSIQIIEKIRGSNMTPQEETDIDSKRIPYII